MAIELPIYLELARPLQRPDTPYRQCDYCHYVAIPTGASFKCPGCAGPPGNGFWPECELIELWNDEIFCWNNEKAELATVVAAMYFEASVFMLLYWATCWLDPDRNWIGAQYREVHHKVHGIQKYMNSLTNFKKIDEALVHVFGSNGKEMLEKVLGEDAGPFWARYMTCRKWRNRINHCGKRIYYETIHENMPKKQNARDQALRASLQFIPQCWVVFSKLWNEYIHKPMAANKQCAGGT